MSMTAIIIIGIIVVLAILSLSKQKIGKSSSNRHKKPQGISLIESPRPDKVLHSNGKKKVSYIHLSVLDNYLKTYHLDQSESSFFQLTTLIIKDGKKYGVDRLSEKFNAIDYSTNIQQSASNVLRFISELEEDKIKLSIKLANEDISSPKIYKTAIEKYLADFNLVALANENLQAAMVDLLNNLYDSGKLQALRKFEVNIKWLNKYQQEGNMQQIARTLQRFRTEIDECRMEIES